MADRAAAINVEVGWHAGARSGLVGLLLGSGLSTTSAGGQRSGGAGYLRAQILIL